MTPNQLAAELGISPKTLRQWLRETWPRDASERGTRHHLSPAQVAAARERWAGSRTGASNSAVSRVDTTTSMSRSPRANDRKNSDEAYVLDLVDAIVGTAGLRQHRFPWLLGDPGRTGARVALPVDGYWPDHKLVVEYRERQHDEATPFFDKRDRLTVSGVHRGEQRRLYDERREQVIPAHGLTLLIVKPSDLSSDARGRLLRRPQVDAQVLSRLLASVGVRV